MTWRRESVPNASVRRGRSPRSIVALLVVFLTMLGGSTLASTSAWAASGTDTITAASITRDAATGNAKWDVTVSLANFWNSSGTGNCTATSACDLYLWVNFTNGGTAQVDSHVNLYGKSSPDVEHFVGSAPELKIKSVRADLNATGSGLTSNTKTVTDPYPTASIAMTVASTGRDATNNQFQWDVTGTASNFRLLDGYCPDTEDCFMVLQANHSDGSTTDLATANDLGGASYPYSHHFVGESSQTKVTSLVLVVEGTHNTFLKTSPAKTVTDGYPVPAFKMNINTTQVRPGTTHPADHDFYSSVTVTADNYSIPEWGCGEPTSTCGVELEVQWRDKETGQLADGYLDGVNVTPGTAHFVYTFSSTYDWGPVKDNGSQWVSDPIALRADLQGENGQHILLPWTSLATRTSDERAAGGNPAENRCACTYAEPVDSSTGALFESANDLSLAGAGPAVDASRAYTSSQSLNTGAFGNGWSSSIDAHLDLSSAAVEVHQENGSTVDFSSTNGTTWTANPGVIATLSTSGSGATQTWTYKRRATQVLTFNSAGYLTKIADLHGTTVTFARDANNNVLTETGTGGRKLTFTWANGHVSSAADSAGRTVSYGYDTSGNLLSVTAADGSVTTYAYDSAGRLSGLTKPKGGTTTTVYNTDGQVVSQTDPLGRATGFAYDTTTTTVTAPDGTKTVDTFSGGLVVKRVLDATGPHPRTTSSAYDAAGNVVTATNARGKSTTYTYDARGNVLTETDPLSQTTTYTYNALNEVLTAKDPLGKTVTNTYNGAGDKLSTTSRGGIGQSWTYNTNGTAATWVDGRGKTTTYGYSTVGLPTSITDPDGHVTSTGYSAAGFVVSQTNGVNKTTSFSRDALGHELSITTPGNHTTTNTYDGDGNLTSVTDARGKVTTNHYNTADELTSTQDPDGNTTQFAYDAAGRLKTTTDANSQSTTRLYDGFGELTSVTDPDSNTTQYGYDADGDKTSTTLPSGATSTATYDDTDQLASTTDAKNKTTSYLHDADGQITSMKDPLNRITSQTWTDDGQPKVTTQPDSSTITQTYDGNGALLTYTNADGLVTTYAYDDAGLPLSRTEPGSMVTGYTYDNAGRLKTTTTPDGHVTTLTYDDDSNLSTSHSDLAGSTDVTYAYNETGQRTAMHDASGNSSYTYDPAGQLTATTNGAGASVGYQYGPTGNISKITYPGSKAVTYQYDNAGQMTSLTDWQNRTTTFSWTANGQLHTQGTPNGVTQTWTYDANGRPTDDAVAGSTSLADYTYTWDAAGQLAADSTTDPLGANIQHQYTYDSVRQLSSVQGTGATNAVTASPGGQLTKTDDGTTYSYNAKQQLTTSTPATGPVSSFTYNGDGDRVTGTIAAVGATPAATTAYTYDRDGNLGSVTLQTGTVISYTSDGDGLRQSRTKGGSTRTFLWETASHLPLLLDDGDHSYVYGPANSLIAQIDDNTGVIQYLHEDLLGSTRLVSNASGAASGAYQYGAFGAVKAHSGSSSAIGFSGNLTDGDTGLVYLRARDYDPVSGQFLQVDPFEAKTRQAYAYANNAPLDHTDNTGRITDGICLGGEAGGWFGGSVQVCAVIAWNDKTGAVELGGDITTGAGLFAPVEASASLVRQVSTARSISQLGGQFFNAGGTADLGFGATGDVFGGYSCGAPGNIVVGAEAGVASGAGASVHGQTTYTSTWTPIHIDAPKFTRDLLSGLRRTLGWSW